MATKFTFAFALILQVIFLIRNVDGQPGVFDITKYGAKADSPDISEALLSAWKEACASTSPSTILIPKGEFNLNQVKLEGPCTCGPIQFQVEGTLKAPSDPNQLKGEGEWITMQYIEQLTISGGGVFDGQGATAWARNDCGKNTKCKKLPYNLSFNFLKQSKIHDVTSLNSKNFHVMVFACKDVSFVNFNITAPGTSINTDGIHIGKSTNINILDTTIGTGDDCISIGDGSQQISITNVTCGPGHGISIGSLGRSPNEEPVDGIFVKNCTFVNTTNGARVKTWPASRVGIATNIQFDDIIMQDVSNPIIVDQEYCPWNQCQVSEPSRVKLSKLGFKNIRGTSATKVAVKFVCSKSDPCEDVEIGDIDLTYHGTEGPANSTCANVKPTFMGKQIPPVCSS